MRKFLFFILPVLFSLLFSYSAQATVARPYKNDLPERDWARYGVNPWRLDTDNDGYSDSWEVRNGFCPTNAERGARVGDNSCQKGSFNLRRAAYTPPSAIQGNYPGEVRRFASCQALTNTILNYERSRMDRIRAETIPLGLAPATGLSSGAAFGAETALRASSPRSTSQVDFSSTNVQVAGVDEGDIVKTDGEYIYSTAEGEVRITKARPAAEAAVVGRVRPWNLTNISEIYVDGDYLVVVGALNQDFAERFAAPQRAGIYPYYQTYTAVQIWNVANPVRPTLVRNADFAGRQVSSRLFNGHLYLVLQDSLPFFIQGATRSADYSRQILSKLNYHDRRGRNVNSNTVANTSLACAGVDYIYPIKDSRLMKVISVPVRNSNAPLSQRAIFGSGDIVYMSPGALYAASSRYERPQGSTVYKQSTEIFKFKLQGGKVELAGSQIVPGNLLNQFALDEANGYLRLVTTQGMWGAAQKNSVYVLDRDLNRVGWYDNFGRGERVYAARFMGSRAYIVTFQQTDPLFVFDLSNPRAPALVGELVMPGYSTYLHPYDDNHLIGLGMEEVNAASVSSSTTSTASSSSAAIAPSYCFGTTRWVTKMALFDVTDPARPVKEFDTVIAGNGAYSQALYDHHAFLFSLSRNLLALPVSLLTPSPVRRVLENSSCPSYDYSQGLFVYKVRLNQGFEFLGNISHLGDPAPEEGMAGLDSSRMVARSLYIGDVLYALSSTVLTAHRMDNLLTIKQVNLTSNSRDER